MINWISHKSGTLFTALIAWLLFGSIAHAVTTISFEATDLYSAGDPFATLGIASVDMASGSFSFDPSAPSISGPTIVGGNVYITEVHPYTDFTVELGSTTFSGFLPSTATDYIQVTDTLSIGVVDDLRVRSNTDQLLTNGIILDKVELLVSTSVGENFVDGTAVPSVAALNTADFRVLHLLFFDGLSSHSIFSDNVTFIEAPVPLPAAFPLFAGGLGLLGLFGWRRRQIAAAT